MEELQLEDVTTPEERAKAFEDMQPKGGSTKDYWDAINFMALKGTRPELRTTREDFYGASLDPSDKDFQELIGKADVETQKAMYGAYSNEHAYKIYSSREIQREAMTRIQGDPISTQLVMGALPALVSPMTPLTSAAAFGTLFKVGKAASRVSAASRAAVAGATAGAVGNVGDELIIGAQDLDTDYQSALMYGVAFGGSLGFLGGLIAGPRGLDNAEVSHAASDTWKTDFKNDPDFIWSADVPGATPKLSIAPQGVPGSKQRLQAQGSTTTERMNKHLIDRIPWLSDVLNSDITKAYMHDSAVGRAVMTKLITPSAALYDKVGNAIAVGRTAFDFKTTQKGINHRKDLGIDEAFVEAQKGLYMGNREKFIKEVSTVYHEAANRQELELADYLSMKLAKFDNEYGNAKVKYLDEEAKKSMGKDKATKEVDPTELEKLSDTKHKKDREKAKEEFTKEFYANNKVEFKHKSQAFVKGAQVYQKFFNEHLSSNNKLGMAGTRSTNPNKLYAPRIIDWDNFKNEAGFLLRFREDAYNAFKAHKSNDDLTEAELRELADEYTSVAQNVKTRQAFTSNSFVAPTLSGDARMKGRKFKFDQQVMSKYLMTDMDELSSRYHYQMSGRQAVHYAFGTDKIDDIMKRVSQDMIAKEGVESTDMLKYIENTILDLSGQLRMNSLSGSPAWQVARTIQAYNSARLGGGFGGNQFIELAASMFMNHLPSVLSGRTGKSFKNVAKVLYTKDKDMDDFNRFLINSGFMEDALHTSRINRMADTEAGWNTGGIEKGLHWFTDRMYKYNGLRYFKGVMEDMTGGAMMKEIPDLADKALAGKLNRSEEARLSRWGLDPESLQDLAQDIKKNYSDTSFNLGGMSELNRDRLQLAIQRGISEVVIQGDSLHLPTWFKAPGALQSLMFQFMRFPMIAHSTYLRRGMSDDQARMAAAVVASTITFLGMKYVREQAAISLGIMDERDAKYDYFDKYRGDEAILKGVIDSTNYIAPLGMFTTVTNAVSSMITGSELGNDYRGTSTMENFMGPTFGGLGNEILKLMQEPATNSMKDERTALKVKALIPGSNLPLINEALKYTIEESF